jgi:hypothetical protein
MNRNKIVENKMRFFLIICLATVMFSCTEDDFSKDYTLVDAGLSVNTAITFDANAGTQEVSIPNVPEGAVWGYRKSADWISVVQYNNRMVISVPLFEGIVEKSILADREGSVTLVKEAAGGTSVEAGSIKVTQTCAVPGSTNWDDGSAPSYSWRWNNKDPLIVDFVNHQNDWNETAVGGDGKPYYKYVYKIIGEDASNFEQTENDTVRSVRTTKLANTEDNNAKESEVVAYFIVTDRDGTKIHLRRKLTVGYRDGDFILDPDKVTLSSDEAEVEVKAVSLNTAADDLKCKIKAASYNWITLPTDVLTGGGNFKFAVAANEDTTAGREAVLELVNESGASFNPPVYLTIQQNQKPEY